MPVLQRGNWGKTERWNYFVPSNTTSKWKSQDLNPCFLISIQKFSHHKWIYWIGENWGTWDPWGCEWSEKEPGRKLQTETRILKGEVGRDSWRWVWCYGWSVLSLRIASGAPVLAGRLSLIPISVELPQGEHFPGCEESNPAGSYERNSILGPLPIRRFHFRGLELLGVFGGAEMMVKVAFKALPANQQQNPYVQVSGEAVHVWRGWEWVPSFSSNYGNQIEVPESDITNQLQTYFQHFLFEVLH